MKLIYRKTLKLASISKARPNSLLLRIPSTIRDMMNFKPNEEVTIDVLEEKDCRTIRIYKNRE